MEDAQWEKVLDARGPWVGVQSRPAEEWPVWVQKLDVELRVWLTGEAVELAEFGFEGSDDGRVVLSAYESQRLWGLIVTTHFVVEVTVEKDADEARAARPSFVVVPRSKITGLRVIPTAQHPKYGLGFTVVASFDGIGREVHFPTDLNEWYFVEESERLRVFSSLRDDLHPLT